MKLLTSHASPYSRKVRLVLHELGLYHTVEYIATTTATDKDLRNKNPLNKIPTLVLDDDSTLYDSPVICEYLVAEAGNQHIFPPAGPKRWQALRLQALADGICDAALRIVLDGRLPEAQRSTAVISHQQAAIDAAIDALEAQSTLLTQDPTIGELAVAAALGYVNFRLPDTGWETTHPRLAAWYATFSTRPSMRETEPM